MCDKQNCGNDGVGAITWQTSELEYCRIHLRKARSEFPELIESVSLL